MDGHIYAFVTCTRVKWQATVEEYAKMVQQTEEEVREDWADDSDYNADSDTIRLEEAIEEHGWIDTGWNCYTLHDSRNDVRPIAEGTYIDLDYLTEDVRDAFRWLGACEDNGDGTFYASDSDKPFDQEWSYSYALHFVRKFYGPKGWTEEAWIPPASMRDDV